MENGALSGFSKCEVVAKLRQLAKNPIDLTEEGVLSAERIKHYVAESCGYKLFYGTERVTDEVIADLESLAVEAKALEKMRRLQEGDVMNVIYSHPSENRAALHTATRDVFDHPQEGEKAREATGLAAMELEKLKSFCARLEQEKKYDELIVIGIGGSDQGPRANYSALEHLLLPGRRVHFIANVDPDDAAAVLKQVNLSRTLVVVISKSGTTLETDTNEALVKEKFKSQGLEVRDHFISVTMPKTPMDSKERYSESFYLWDWIGGRYSTTSMVGGIVIAFAFGFPVFLEFLRGAHEMDQVSLQPEIHKNLPLLAALLGIWNRNFLDLPTLGIIPYAQGLRDYPAHLQQVDMESNGKSIDQRGSSVDYKTGPVLWGSLGTNAQHSYFQLLHQGTSIVPLLMIGYEKSRYGEDLVVKGTTSQEKLLANLFAQSIALSQGSHSDNPNKVFRGNRPTTILLGKQLTPYSVGALLAFYEHKVAFQGFIWGINSFDQEGVQLGKITANRLIECFAARRNNKETSSLDPLGDAYLEFLGE